MPCTIFQKFLNTENVLLTQVCTFISQVVLTFVQTRGYLDSEYKVVTNFPRRDVSNNRCVHCNILFLVFCSFMFWKLFSGRGDTDNIRENYSAACAKSLSSFSSAAL